MDRYNDLARKVVDSAYKVHSQLGPGLLETVYEVSITHEIRKRGLNVERQKPIPIEYDGLKFNEGFKADLLIDDLLIVELKSLEKLLPVHKKQLLTYLRLDNKNLDYSLTLETH